MPISSLPDEVGIFYISNFYSYVMSVLKFCLSLLIGSFLFLPLGYFVLPTAKPEGVKSSTVKGEDIAAYVINFDKSGDRYQHIQPLVAELGYPYERISAVDGSKLQEAELDDLVNFSNFRRFTGRNPRRRNIEGSLSHLNVWRNFLKSGHKYALVLEDDMQFDPAKLRGVIEQLQFYPHLWDITSFEVSHRGAPVDLAKLGGTDLVLYLTRVSHIGAYIINRDAAQKLLARALPIQMPIDHYFTRSWEFGLIFAGVEPRAVQQVGASEIKGTKVSIPHEVDPSEQVYRSYYEVQSGIIRFFYNLKLFFTLKNSA